MDDVERDWANIVRTSGAYLQITQSLQAKEIGVSYDALRMWEYGDRTPGPRGAQKIDRFMHQWFGRDWTGKIERLWELGLKLPPNRQRSRWLIAVGQKEGADMRVNRWAFESTVRKAKGRGLELARQTRSTHVRLYDRVSGRRLDAPVSIEAWAYDQDQKGLDDDENGNQP